MGANRWNGNTVFLSAFDFSRVKKSTFFCTVQRTHDNGGGTRAAMEQQSKNVEEEKKRARETHKPSGSNEKCDVRRTHADVRWQKIFCAPFDRNAKAYHF